MSEKRAYYLEMPDKDLAILLMDDGKTQEILTTSANVPDVWFEFMREKGFEVHGYSRNWQEYEDEKGEANRYSAWYEITGNLIRIGTHSGLQPPSAGRAADEEDESKPLEERADFPGKYPRG